MERREAPRGIVDPGPSPWLDPAPVTVAVWRPIDRDCARRPDPAVIGFLPPGSVLVEIFVAGHLARDIVRGHRLLLARVAPFAPALELVYTDRGSDFFVQRLLAANAGGLPGMHGKRDTSAGYRGVAATNRYCGEAVVAIGVDTVIAGPQQRDRHVGGRDFQRLFRFQAAHVDLHRTLRHADLDGAVV